MYRYRLPSAQADGELEQRNLIETGQMCLTGWAPVKTHSGFCSVQIPTQSDLPFLGLNSLSTVLPRGPHF